MENRVLELAQTTPRIRLSHITPRPSPCYASTTCRNARIANATRSTGGLLDLTGNTVFGNQMRREK